MEEPNFYQMYLQELQGIRPCEDAELAELLPKLLDGDFSVTERLIEGNLFRVLPIAKEFQDRGVLFTDLVQEGPMALTMAVGDYSDGNYGDFISFIEEEIRSAMQKEVDKQNLSDKTAKRMLDRVELLNAVTEKLAQDYGREATLPELAEKMQMSEEEVKDIMRLAVNAMTAGDAAAGLTEESAENQQ